MSFSNKSNTQEFMYNPLFTDVTLPSAFTFTNLGAVSQIVGKSIGTGHIFNNSLNLVSYNRPPTIYSIDVSSTPTLSWSFSPYPVSDTVSIIYPGFPPQVNQPFIGDALNNLIVFPTVAQSTDTFHILAVDPTAGTLVWDFDTKVSVLVNGTIFSTYPIALVPYLGGIIVVVSSVLDGTVLDVFNIQASTGLQLYSIQVSMPTTMPTGFTLGNWGDGNASSGPSLPPQLFSDGVNFYIYSSYSGISTVAGVSHPFPLIFLASYNISSGAQNWNFTDTKLISSPNTLEFICAGNSIASYSNGNFYLPVLHNSSYSNNSPSFQTPQDFGILPINASTGTVGTYIHLDNLSLSFQDAFRLNLFGTIHIDSTNLYASLIFTAAAAGTGFFRVYQVNLSTSSVASMSLTAPLQGLQDNSHLSGLIGFGDTVHIYYVTNSSFGFRSPISSTQLSIITKSNFTLDNLNISSHYSGDTSLLPNGHFVGFGASTLTVGGLFPSPKSGKIYFIDFTGGYIWSIS